MDTEPGGGGAPRNTRRRRLGRLLRHAVAMPSTAHRLAVGYLGYMLLGWLALLLPVAQEAPVGAMDALFIAVSAVSTTGLVTVDPGTSFTLFGEVVILLLIQAGGLGYMTAGSFAYLALLHRLSGTRRRTARAAFGLPEGMDIAQFLRAVVIFSLAVEAVGAAILWQAFAAAGKADALWLGIFHAVSAFCTAGFSLFATSLEAFRDDPVVVLAVSALSVMGAMGFLVVVDLWQKLRGAPRTVGFSALVILRATGLLIGLGTLVLGLSEPAIVALSGWERWGAAFFQAMTASTTVGFNTVPIGPLAPAALMILMALMFVGASPAGTGGGLKTTSVAALLGLVGSVLRGRTGDALFAHDLPLTKVRLAAAGLCLYLVLFFVASVALFLTEPAAGFAPVVFEVLSALGTVGLSMGLTGGLSEAGKVIVIVLMFAGRVGILTFALVFAIRARDEGPHERSDIVV